MWDPGQHIPKGPGVALLVIVAIFTMWHQPFRVCVDDFKSTNFKIMPDKSYYEHEIIEC